MASGNCTDCHLKSHDLICSGHRIFISKINFMLAKDKSIEVDGYSGFVFTAKSGRPLMPNGVNSVLYNIVDAYNKTEGNQIKSFKEETECQIKK